VEKDMGFDFVAPAKTKVLATPQNMQKLTKEFCAPPQQQRFLRFHSRRENTYLLQHNLEPAGSVSLAHDDNRNACY
jgi:hypothetical protein